MQHIIFKMLLAMEVNFIMVRFIRAEQVRHTRIIQLSLPVRPQHLKYLMMDKVFVVLMLIVTVFTLFHHGVQKVVTVTIMIPRLGRFALLRSPLLLFHKIAN